MPEECKAYVKLGDGIEYEVYAVVFVVDTMEDGSEYAKRTVTLTKVRFRLSSARFAVAAQAAMNAKRKARVTIMVEGRPLVSDELLEVQQVSPRHKGGLAVTFGGTKRIGKVVPATL